MTLSGREFDISSNKKKKNYLDKALFTSKLEADDNHLAKKTSNGNAFIAFTGHMTYTKSHMTWCVKKKNALHIRLEAAEKCSRMSGPPTEK